MRKGHLLLIIACFVLSGCQTANHLIARARSYGNTEIYQGETDTVWNCAEVESIWVNGHEDDKGNWVDDYYEHVVKREGHWGKRSEGVVPQEIKRLEGSDRVWHCARTEVVLVKEYDDHKRLIGERIVHRIIEPGHFGKEDKKNEIQ